MFLLLDVIAISKSVNSADQWEGIDRVKVGTEIYVLAISIS